jgi:antirestriction protein ArdC
MPWAESVEKAYTAPIWMTYRHAQELGAHVRNGETGSLVVYASGRRRSRSEPFSAER